MKQILIILLCANSTVFAQTERFSASIHSGYALSTVSDYYAPVPITSRDYKSTFNAGVDIRRQMGEKGLFLQTGFRWTCYGWKNLPNISYWYGYGSETSNINSTNLSLFTIPLIATYKFQKLIPGFTVSAGPQISLFSFRKWKQNGNVLSTQWSTPDLAFSGFLSLGYEHNLNHQWILGGKIFSNLIPREVYNVGLSISARYIIKQISAE